MTRPHWSSSGNGPRRAAGPVRDGELAIRFRGRSYCIGIVGGIVRVAGGLLAETVDLDHLAELILVLDAAADELREGRSGELGDGGRGDR